MHYPHFRALTALCALLACTRADADVVAAPDVPASQQPQIAAGAHGAAQIDIAPANAAGVSLNNYARFDVDAAGAVLNNAPEANARLQGRAAQVIVNQVLGDAPSLLRGAVEVSGARADVVVANPHGIHCDGCGFVNAGRATLLAGTALLDDSDGPLQTLHAGGSRLSIGAGGLSGAAERVDLIGRRIAIDGRVRAADLRLVAGLNRVGYAAGDVQRLPPVQTAGLAIDLGELGAMTAGRIQLIATEDGAGVRSRGQLDADVQDLRLDVAGDLQLANAVARRDLRVDVRQGSLDGITELRAGRDLALRVDAAVDNAGRIDAGGDMQLDAGAVHNVGGILHATHDLALRSADAVRNSVDGRIEAGGALSIDAAGALDNRGGRIDSGSLWLHAGTSVHNTGGLLESVQGPLQVWGTTIDNDAGSIAASGALQLRQRGDGALRNAGGTIAGSASGVLQADELRNGGGRIDVDGDLALQAVQVSNAGGRVSAGGTLTVHARQRVNNTDGRIDAGSVALVAGDLLVNAHGQLRAAHTLAVHVPQFNNYSGRVGANAGMQLDIGERLFNETALIVAGGELVLEVGELSNGYGMLQSGSDLRLDVRGGPFDNCAGRIEAPHGALLVRARNVDVHNAGGDLVAGRALGLDAAVLTNTHRARAMGEYVDLRLRELQNHDSRIEARGALLVHADLLDNGDGRIKAGNNLTLRLGQALHNADGHIKTRGDLLRIDVPGGEIDNVGGRLQAPFGHVQSTAQILRDVPGAAHAF